jgi:hypothetical protein
MLIPNVRTDFQHGLPTFFPAKTSGGDPAKHDIIGKAPVFMNNNNNILTNDKYHGKINGISS